MKQKPAKKHVSAKSPKKNASPYLFIQITAVTFILVIIILVGSLTMKAVTEPHVLGETSGPTLLADHGNDSQGGDTHGDNNVSNNQNPQQSPEPTQPAEHLSGETPQGHLEAQTEGNKGEFNLETRGTHIEMKKEDNGDLHITAHQEDGTEVELQNDAIEQINEALKDKDVEVGTTSAHGFSIKSGDVEAETHFPLSIDPNTKILSVTTPAGTKEVTVLPDEAVQNLLQHQILSSVNPSTASGAAGNTIALTQVNDQPVFAVQGISDKKLIGLFPVSFDKTVFVSTQTGQVVQTQESFLNKLLEALSF